MKRFDVLIIGAGAAGLSAAIYALRSGKTACVFEKSVPGGQILNTPSIENYPALGETDGYSFTQSLVNQAQKHGAAIVNGDITDISLDCKVKSLVCAGERYEASSVIIAAGCSRRSLNVAGEEQFAGRGVSYCATCDGAFFRGRDVCIVGGGNTALEDALFLANHCRTVYLIHRRDEFRAEDFIVQQVKNKGNIQLVLNSEITEITGENVVTGVSVKNKFTGKVSSFAVNGVFIAIGVVSASQPFCPPVSCDENGYIIAGEDCKTNIAGVFAAGDIRTKQVRQLVTAAADGAVAGLAAATYTPVED